MPPALPPLLVVALAAFALLRGSRGSGALGWGVATAMVAVTVVASIRMPTERPPAQPPVRVANSSELVSSAACRSCHPSEYASWHDTYHRTMTQAALSEAMIAPIDPPVSLVLDGRTYGLARRDGEVWASLPGSETRKVALATGSHHYQAYWMAGPGGGEAERRFELFPFVYLVGERRWLPRREVFVQPPGVDGPVHWEDNCIQCHTTGGNPGRSAADRPLSPEVAELGIACEACHGPGARHVEAHANPFERYAAYASDRADPTIVNPSRLDAERASMICGACHAYTYPRDEDDFWAHGYTLSYRPGQDLADAKILLTADVLARPGAPTVDTDLANLFYDDGTVRIGGREYNGLVLSACFARGTGDNKLGCLSCHWMHDSDPRGQLARGREGDGACAACHDRARYAAETHTHHPRGSAGSACVGCHMPMTSYALLKSIRSHRIDSPSTRGLSSSDRPNACNLCHLDRSLAWAASRLEGWYGQAPATVEATQEVAETSAGAVWLLSGDPGQRAIAAAAMATPGARAAGTARFSASVLETATTDPYAAVRFIARRSLDAVRGETGGVPVDLATRNALVARRSTRALTLSE
jgi:predicted CXXCH cytochrome family protein